MHTPTLGALRASLSMGVEQDPLHAVIGLDPEGRVLEWSTGAANVFGYCAQEMLGHPLDRLFPPEDLARGESTWAVCAAKTYGHAEEDRWMVRKDAARAWITCVTTALRDEAGDVVGFLKIARDRTDLKSHVETLQQRLEAAATAERERHVVLGTLAHELRNPLGEVANAARILERLVASDDERVTQSLHAIERQVGFIEALVADLLESTRLATGKARLRYENVDLREVVERAAETCRAALHGRRQVLDVALDESIILRADRVRLQQVLVNLIGNSSKYSPEGARILVRATLDRDQVVLKVKDPGRGIDASMLPRIFDLFSQAGEGHGAGHGLGLGLGVVKTLVEMHGGSVAAHSGGLGRGTEMTVRLPLPRVR